MFSRCLLPVLVYSNESYHLSQLPAALNAPAEFELPELWGFEASFKSYGGFEDYTIRDFFPHVFSPLEVASFASARGGTAILLQIILPDDPGTLYDDTQNLANLCSPGQNLSDCIYSGYVRISFHTEGRVADRFGEGGRIVEMGETPLNMFEEERKELNRGPGQIMVRGYGFLTEKDTSTAPMLESFKTELAKRPRRAASESDAADGDVRRENYVPVQDIHSYLLAAAPDLVFDRQKVDEMDSESFARCAGLVFELNGLTQSDYFDLAILASGLVVLDDDQIGQFITLAQTSVLEQGPNLRRGTPPQIATDEQDAPLQPDTE
jgi:hypothetical protein